MGTVFWRGDDIERRGGKEVIEPEEGGAGGEWGELRGGGTVGEEDAWTGVVEQVGEAGRGIGGVEGDVGGAGEEDTEDAGDHGG